MDEIDLNDPTAIIAALAEDLAQQGLLASVEAAGGGRDRSDLAWRAFDCPGDMLRIEVAIDEDGAPGWSVTGTFESSRAVIESQAAAGDSLDDFSGAVAAALAR